MAVPFEEPRRRLLKAYWMIGVMLVFGLVLAVYYCYLHRKPFTQNAFVVANTRPVSPLVEGYLTDVYVKNHQKVKTGDPLFKIFQPPYALAVERLEFAVSGERAKLASAEAQLSSARNLVERDRAEAANRRYLAEQSRRMYQGNAVSQTYAEECARAAEAAEAELSASQSKAQAAEHDVAVLRASVEQLLRELELAEIYYGQTVVYALCDGYVANMYVSPGGYYRPGEVLFALIEDSPVWVQANFEETDLSLIAPGQRVKIWLWQYPGREFSGEVESVNLSAERRHSAPSGVQSVAKENQWFLLPQRFPVQIRLHDPPDDLAFNLGASAFVQIDISSQLFKQIVWRVLRW